MIRVYTKTRHTEKIHRFLSRVNLEHEIFTIHDNPPIKSFDLGISYAYPRKIIEPLLSTPSRGFVNFHPGPLPKYKGPNQYQQAIKNKEIHWGVTVHYMDENYDTGDIIKIKYFDYHEPITSVNEANAISHWFLFHLFKETIVDIYNKKLKSYSQSSFPQIYHSS
ncbi:MAG: formyltransferase family protein [Nitrosopumilaceae archaeon]